MSTFYGTVQGQAGKATRCGGTKSGIETTAASWHGSIRVQIGSGQAKEDQQIQIYASPWHGAGPSGCIFHGSWDELTEALTKNTILRSDLNVLEDVALSAGI